MHEQYYRFEPGSRPLEIIADQKMYVPYSYIPLRRRTTTSLIYFDSKGKCHRLSEQDAEYYKKWNASFEECLEKKDIVVPVDFLPTIATVNKFKTGDDLSKFYKVCRETKIRKGHKMVSLTPYGSVVGKIYSPEFNVGADKITCTVEVSLTQIGIQTFKKYLKPLKDDVAETIQSSSSYERLQIPLSEYELNHLYLTKDGTLIFEYLADLGVSVNARKTIFENVRAV